MRQHFEADFASIGMPLNKFPGGYFRGRAFLSSFEHMLPTIVTLT